MAVLCPRCRSTSSSPSECTACGVVFSKCATREESKSDRRPTTSPTQRPEPRRAPYELFFVPIFFSTALLVKSVAPFSLLIAGVRVWLHEFGHATMAWCAGHAATPLGVGWTSIEADRSWFVCVCFLFLIGVMAVRSWRRRAWLFTGFAGFLLALQMHLMFVVSVDRASIAITWGGVAGEFVFSVFLVLCFFFSRPGPRADFARWAALALGALCFVDVYTEWSRIAANQASIPWGSIFGGESDEAGDMNRLYDEWGWTRSEIVSSYIRLARGCTVLLLFGYAWAWFVTLRSKAPRGDLRARR